MNVSRRDFLGLLSKATVGLALAPQVFAESMELLGTPEKLLVVPILAYDVINGNKRYYSKEVALSICDQINKGTIFGGHVDSRDHHERVNLVAASHVVRKCFVEETEQLLVAEIEILRTPRGDKLRQLLWEDPESVDFRLGGQATIKPQVVVQNAAEKTDSNIGVICVVQNDYKLNSVFACYRSASAPLVNFKMQKVEFQPVCDSDPLPYPREMVDRIQVSIRKDTNLERVQLSD